MHWRDRYSLSTRFLAASAVVLCVTMIVLGTWMNYRITRSVLATSGADGAAFMRGLLEQRVQRMAPDGTLHAEDIAALDGLFVGTVLGQSIVSVKLWITDGSDTATIIYSSMAKDTIGEQHVSTDVQEAWSGDLVSEFEDMISKESLYEQGLDLPLIEIYSPLYRRGTGEVVAVGEIYEDASILAQQLRESVQRTWLIVCMTTLLMLALLYAIVRGGNRVIAEQQSALGAKVREAEYMAFQNHALRLEADRTRMDANEANEELLGRIGLDIHDGPIQLLTLIRLRLDEALEKFHEDSSTGFCLVPELNDIAEKLSAIINEMRDLSIGLVLPELDDLSPRQTIELAIERHENLTGTCVTFECGEMPDSVASPLKTCLYRIVQESLSNSFKHAGGVGQQVATRAEAGSLLLNISDMGSSDTPPESRQPKSVKLGQRGIRNRVVAFGGTLAIESRSPNGTRVRVSIPIQYA